MIHFYCLTGLLILTINYVLQVFVLFQVIINEVILINNLKQKYL